MSAQKVKHTDEKHRRARRLARSQRAESRKARKQDWVAARQERWLPPQ